jgi:monofunctional biosynthetic peptidoglycan transglycosylase
MTPDETPGTAPRDAPGDDAPPSSPRPKRPRWRRLLLGALAALGIALVGLPVLLLLIWRWVPPPTTAFMVRERVSALARRDADFRLAYRWTPYDRISDHAKVAVVAAEDQNFASHSGFDVPAIEKALERNRRGGRVRGASTISQQVAKNLFLTPDRNFVRKGLEAWFTVLIEFLWPKRRILEVHLNIAEFGPGVFGVTAASRRYFDKEPAALTPREAALLAAVLPSPKRLRAERPSAYVERRVDWILGQMNQLGGAGYLKEL